MLVDMAKWCYQWVGQGFRLDFEARSVLSMLAAAGLVLLAGRTAWAGHYEAIYAFQGAGPYGGQPPYDSGSPRAGLVADAQGRLYGTSLTGGLYGNGTVFMVTPPAAGQPAWTEQIIHNFTSDGGDGALPMASVTLGSDGSVYGTTEFGGSGGAGMVFKLSNAPGWPETVLHGFNDGVPNDGGDPEQAVVFGPQGLLYSTTFVGGSIDSGTVFSLSPQGDQVEYQVIHNFLATRPDGYWPNGLTSVAGRSFNGFIGTTQQSQPGQPNGGIYSLSINPDGSAKESLLYEFKNVNFPTSNPIIGQGKIAGAFYGCATKGGTHGQGGIYSLAPDGAGRMTETVLYNFGDQPHDPQAGQYDQCNLIQGTADGTLYGTTDGGGGFKSGVFFELIPPAKPKGAWTEKLDVDFNPASSGGTLPQGALVRVGGKLYGVTESGGAYGYGAVFELTP